MSVYTSFINVADKLLTKYGADATITRDTTAHAVRALLTDYHLREVDGTLVLRGDIKAMAAAKTLAIVPSTKDLFTTGGKNYRIIAVSPLRPGGVDIIYEMQLRAM